jgi:hemoglobin
MASVGNQSQHSHESDDNPEEAQPETPGETPEEALPEETLPEETLFERLGGSGAVDDARSAFYDRVFNDPDLLPFFEGVDTVKLQRMQSEFFTAALGGPETYAALNLTEVHRDLGIESQHVSMFTGHMVDTMIERGMPPEAVDEVVARAAVIGQDVLGLPNEAG